MWRVTCTALLGVVQINAHADFTFAAYGDTPYVADEEPQHIALIAEINRAQPAFTIHVGDFKAAWTPCTDELFQLRREQFMLFHAPLIYAPGDNEWQDCRRAWGAQRDPLERLAKLRQLFFADSYSLGQQRITLTQQSAAYPEHARWAHDGVLFITLNAPGGDNNKDMPDEAVPRKKAQDAWVSAAFDEARQRGYRALVIAMQANPFATGNVVKSSFDAPMNAITREAQLFNGEVLLIHGDTHRYRFDQPLFDLKTRKHITNVTRLEVFGYPTVNWVRIRVKTTGAKITFEASPGSR